MKKYCPTFRDSARWIGLALVLCGLLMAPRALAGSWTQLANPAPGAVCLMLLLPDGTVMVANNDGTSDDIGNAWYKLTPDIHGSYVNGSWTNLASMHCNRIWYSSDVLRDGRVFVAGGEYGNGTTNAEVYDPQLNTWTIIPVPPGLITTNPVTSGIDNEYGFMDSMSFTLPDGRVLITPVDPATNGYTVIFDPSSNTIYSGPQLAHGVADADEQSMVKLPDGSELTFGGNMKSQRYIPSLNAPLGEWIKDEDLTQQLFSFPLGEIGPGFLLPNGNAFFIGGPPVTVIYTPSGSTNFGSWTVGPVIPNGLGTADSSGAMMVNGKILCAVGNYSDYDAPTFFYEYDYAANSFNTNIPAPGNPTPGSSDNVATFNTTMLDLPDGTVLYAHQGSDLYVYTPDSGPLAAWKPAIISVTLNSDASYLLTGTGLNGISEGAAYGDDAQMDSNYPLVRLTDANGNVYYGRTFNWSSTGVQTGTNIVTTEFLPPPNLPQGNYSLVVTANGIASDPVPFVGAVWVDFNYSSLSPQLGTFANPFSTIAQGVSAVASGGTISIKPGTSAETLTISKPMKLTAVGGIATIGQ